AYQFDKYFSSLKEHSSLRTVQVLLDRAPSLQDKKAFNLGLRIADGVCLARDLVNEPPNHLTPEALASRAKAIAKRNKLYCKVLDEEGILKAKMNLHAAVGQGSDNKPTFIHLAYKPPRASKRIVFVGKGITFDSGGLCIKPA